MTSIDIARSAFPLPKKRNIIFWIGNDPPPIRKFSENSSNLVQVEAPNVANVDYFDNIENFDNVFNIDKVDNVDKNVDIQIKRVLGKTLPMLGTNTW